MEITKLYPKYYKPPNIQEIPVFKAVSKRDGFSNLRKPDLSEDKVTSENRAPRDCLPAVKDVPIEQSPINTLSRQSVSHQELDSGVKKDMLDAKKAVEKINKLDKLSDNKLLLNTLGVLPPIRRIESVPDKIKEGNKEGAIAQAGVAVLNMPSDATQLGYALKEAKFIKENGVKSLPKRVYQREMPFIKGTPFEGLVRKYKWLEKADTTLFDTKFGKKTREVFRIKFDSKIDVSDIKGVFSQAESIKAVAATKGNPLQNIVERSLLRISNIGILTTAAFEIPAIVRSVTETEGGFFDKAKALGIQLMKSGGYTGLVTAGIAIGGAVLFPYGILAELAGMAIGSALGLSASKDLNQEIDNIFKGK